MVSGGSGLSAGFRKPQLSLPQRSEVISQKYRAQESRTGTAPSESTGQPHSACGRRSAEVRKRRR